MQRASRKWMTSVCPHSTVWDSFISAAVASLFLHCHQKQSYLTSYAHKLLINRHLAYSTVCHTSKERLPGLLSTYTIKRSLRVWALLLASPFTFMLLSVQPLLGVCGPHWFSDPVSTRICLFRKPREERSQSWSLCTCGWAKPEQGQRFKVRLCWFH